MVAFTITEINYLVVSLFCDVVLLLFYLLYVCSIKFFGCAIGLVSGMALATMPMALAAMASPKSFTMF